MIETAEKIIEREISDTNSNIAEFPNKGHYINSDTFRPTGETLGFGCWGKVDVYRDAGGHEWAIKVFSPNDIALQQMKEREWTEEHVMRNESVPIDAVHHHVLPRIIERDKNGKLFVAMPVCREGDLSRILHGLDLKQSLVIARDTADALAYFHNQREPSEFEWNYSGKRKAIGDIKPLNILMRGERAFVTDLGSSTCISTLADKIPRGPHGDINYRAPESFDENANPTPRADIWALGAMLYEANAGHGIYDGINLSELDEEELQKIVSKRIRKNTPRKIRKFLKKALAVSSWDRFDNGAEAGDSLDRIIENLDTKKAVMKHIRKWTLPLAVSTVLPSFLFYGVSTYEPQRLEMPNTQRVYGMLYKPNFEEEGINFEMEDIPDLPEAREIGWSDQGITKMAKLSTNNRVVAYLAKTHSQAVNSRGLIRDNGPYTEAQFNTYIAYTTNDERSGGRINGVWPIWAKSIEVALTQSKTTDGRVDLEDVMTISRVGVDKVDEAKRISRSVDYANYRNAKDINGNYIIPKDEQRFIETWIAYYNADLD